MSEEYFWVVHILSGTRRYDGPYKQRKSAEIRASHIQGGEVHVFRSWSDKPEEVEQEFVGEVARE